MVDGTRTIGTLWRDCGPHRGLVGFGEVPRRIAPILAGFGAKIIYHDMVAHDGLGATKRSLEEVLADSDILSLHVPLVDATRDLICAKNIAKMKDGAVVFIHPLGTSLGKRLNRDYLSNTIGQPVETTIALSQMIFAGVFDRYPNLKVLAAHGGGYLPHYIGRSDNAWSMRPEIQSCADLPSSYLRKIWFDTVIFDDTYLGHLIDTIGADRVAFGTDYAFDMGDYDVDRLAKSLPDAAPAAVMGGTAADLLGL